MTLTRWRLMSIKTGMAKAEATRTGEGRQRQAGSPACVSLVEETHRNNGCCNALSQVIFCPLWTLVTTMACLQLP
eukprot:4546084-Amphidinium_carterae.1